MESAANALVATRPTAVSLPNAVHIVMSGLNQAETIDVGKKRGDLPGGTIYTLVPERSATDRAVRLTPYSRW